MTGLKPCPAMKDPTFVLMVLCFLAAGAFFGAYLQKRHDERIYNEQFELRECSCKKGGQYGDEN